MFNQYTTQNANHLVDQDDIDYGETLIAVCSDCPVPDLRGGCWVGQTDIATCHVCGATEASVGGDQ